MTHCGIGGCDKSFPINVVGQIRFLGRSSDVTPNSPHATRLKGGEDKVEMEERLSKEVIGWTDSPDPESGEGGSFQAECRLGDATWMTLHVISMHSS